MKSLIQAHCRETEYDNQRNNIMLLFTYTDKSDMYTYILKVPVNCWCEQMAAVWQMQKMHYSVASVVDFSVRRHLFEHGDMGQVKSCKIKMIHMLCYTSSGGSIHLLHSVKTAKQHCKDTLQVKILIFAKCAYSKVSETLSW